MSRHILALITWAGALLWLFGVVTVMPSVMATGAIIAATFGLLWGLVATLEPRPNLAEYRADVRARRDQQAADDELPYLPIDEGEFVFEHEADEWRRGVRDMTEADREVTYEKSRRAAVGVTGDAEDER